MEDQPTITLIGTTNRVDYSCHGHWVRHRSTGRNGRIGCVTIGDGVAVCWDGGGFGWYHESELKSLNRPPEPWYRATDLLRRRTNGLSDDIWWVA